MSVLRLRPLVGLVLVLLSLLPWDSGCGGGAGTSVAPAGQAAPGGVVATPPEPPPLRWTPEEHGEHALARAWADEGGWVESAARVLEDKDPGARELIAHLERLDDPVRRPEVLRELLDLSERSGHPGLTVALRAFPADLARVVVVLSKDRPEWSMRVADRFFFEGPRKLDEAWEYPPLQTAVTKICRRTDFDAADIQTGPARVWALKVAGKARVREAIPEILKAAGRARGDAGRWLPADPYGPAASMAQRVIHENETRRRSATGR